MVWGGNQMLDDLPLFKSAPEPPALPKSIRYWDDFEEKFHTIDDLGSEPWSVFFDGISTRLTFPALPQHQRLLLSAVTADLIVSRSAKTAANYVSALRSVDPIQADRDNHLKLHPRSKAWPKPKCQHRPTAGAVSATMNSRSTTKAWRVRTKSTTTSQICSEARRDR